MKMKFAISSNDLKNVSNDYFGQSHFYVIYELRNWQPKKNETRENVLFRQSCDLNGRTEHLHGLLGDIDYFFGSKFQSRVREDLEALEHECIKIPTDRIDDIVGKIGQYVRKITDATQN